MKKSDISIVETLISLGLAILIDHFDLMPWPIQPSFIIGVITTLIMIKFNNVCNGCN